MSKVIFDITMSLDGYVAGPNPSLDEPLGVGGEDLHTWALNSAAWRASHGREGGETGADSDVIEELQARVGTEIMGRGKFGPPAGGPWGDDPWQGWWGDEPPFGHPVFVVTHHAREPLTLGETTFNFVTEGIEPALEQARAAAGEKDILIGGGGEVIQQYLAAGLVDECQIHVAPMVLGGGASLFGALGDQLRLEPVRVLDSSAVTHIKYRVLR
jgi:dihydrofolate reductase